MQKPNNYVAHPSGYNGNQSQPALQRSLLDGHLTNVANHKGPTVIIETLPRMQLQITYIIFVHTLFLLTPITNSSGKELGESVIFQSVLQAYPTCHSWIITVHVSLGHLECYWKAFNRQLAKTQQLLCFLDQQPSALTQLL